MTIALFGATGKTGQAFLEAIKSTDHKIQALARDKSKLANDTDINIIEGNILNFADVDRTIKNADLVISLIGHVKNSPSDLQTQATSLIIKSMNQNMVRRLIVLTGAGVPVEEDHPKFIDKIMTVMLKIVAKNRYWDGVNHANLIKSTDLDWTVVRVPILNDSVSHQDYGVGYVGDSQLDFRISRNNVAKFILEIVQDPKYYKKLPYIAWIK